MKVVFQVTVTLEEKFLVMVCGALSPRGKGVGSKSNPVTEKLGDWSTQLTPVMVTLAASLLVNPTVTGPGAPDQLGGSEDT